MLWCLILLLESIHKATLNFNPPSYDSHVVFREIQEKVICSAPSWERIIYHQIFTEERSDLISSEITWIIIMSILNLGKGIIRWHNKILSGSKISSSSILWELIRAMGRFTIVTTVPSAPKEFILTLENILVTKIAIFDLYL